MSKLKILTGAVLVVTGLLIALTGMKTIKFLSFSVMTLAIGGLLFDLFYNLLPATPKSAADTILLSTIGVICLVIGYYVASKFTTTAMTIIPMVFGAWAFS